MNEQDITEQIEDYLSGDMQGEALVRFNQRIKSDQELAAQVELYRTLDDALIDEGALALQEQTDTLGNDFFGVSEVETKPATFTIYRRSLAIAATVLLLVAGAWLWWSANATLSGPELFASYYEAPVFSNSVRGGDTPQKDKYTLAVEAYQAGKLEAAAQFFKEHANATPADIRASFGLASAYIQQQPPELNEAARYFQQVIDQGESLLVDRSKWYLALIYLQQENKTAAQLLLQELLNAEDKQLAKQADTLLEDL